MAMTPCGKGHFYNPDETASCPYCGVAVEIGETRPFTSGMAGAAAVPAPDRTRVAGETRGRRVPVEGETVHVWNKKLGGIDPVVGWLVCIEGPDRGRDFRIHTERNFIGRAPTMDIAITGDAAISRENHAVVSYNPKRHGFRVAPGDSRGMVYLNDEEVMGAMDLQPYDRIELGATKLLFVPFCCERFVWPVKAPAKGD